MSGPTGQSSEASMNEIFFDAGLGFEGINREPIRNEDSGQKELIQNGDLPDKKKILIKKRGVK